MGEDMHQNIYWVVSVAKLLVLVAWSVLVSTQQQTWENTTSNRRSNEIEAIGCGTEILGGMAGGGPQYSLWFTDSIDINDSAEDFGVENVPSGLDDEEEVDANKDTSEASEAQAKGEE